MSSDFGTIGFGTLEPGNGTLEEQICFTGVTQNSNGTATLTGVSSVAFVYPYTRTSGLSKTHAGSTTFIISNTSGFYDSLTGKSDDETITGTWTFTNPNYPRMDTSTPFPTDNEQLATKAYADSLTFTGAPNATLTQKGIVQLPTQAQVDAKTELGSTGATLAVPPNRVRSTLLSDYVIDTSATPNIILIAPSPSITSYIAGQIFSTKVALTNTTTTPVINVNGLGNKSIIRSNGSSPYIGDLLSGDVLMVEYNGTNFEIQSPAPTQISPSGTPAQGDIVYYTGTQWARLTAGTTPAVLMTGGTGANPTWGVSPTHQAIDMSQPTVVVNDNNVDHTIGTYPFPALLTNQTVWVRGSTAHDNGSAAGTATVSIKMNGTTIFTVAGSIASGSGVPLDFDVFITTTNPSNAQRSYGFTIFNGTTFTSSNFTSTANVSSPFNLTITIKSTTGAGANDTVTLKYFNAFLFG